MKRIDWTSLDDTARDAALARPMQSRAADLRQGVEAIVADVRARGDVALRELTARYDGTSLDDLAVTDAEFDAAEAR